MDIKIRKGNEQDNPQIIELFKEFAEFQNISDKMINSVEKMTEEKDFFNCFVAETHDQKIIGYATYFFTYYTFTGKSLYMDDLYVKTEYRAKGIGTKLINRMIEFGKSSNCHKLRWQVSNWNKAAMGFYKSIGATIDTVEQNCDLNLVKGK